MSAGSPPDPVTLAKRLAGLSPERRQYIERLLQKEKVETARLPIAPRPRVVGAIPMSFGQQRLWLLDQLGLDSAAYTISKATRFLGPLDSRALERSLNEVICRHEVLRTTFGVVAGQPVQVISPSLSVAVVVTDLTQFPEAERIAVARRLVGAAVTIPFDLRQGPLLRAQLFRLAEYDHVLLLSMHHIIFDGWSSAVLDREISALYGAFAAGRTPALPGLAIQYADFAQWQQASLQGEVLATHLAYWKHQLAGLPALELPTDHARPSVQSYCGATLSFSLPTDLTAKLRALCRREGVTMFMTLLAAFQTLLARYTGQTDIVVGSPIANRNRAETVDLIGFFVNTLVLRTNLSGDPAFRALLGRTRDVALGAFAHEDLPFEKLVDELQPERTLIQSPLVQVMFAVQNVPADGQPLAGLTGQRFDFDRRTSLFDLTMALAESEQGLDGLVEYRTDLFETATIQRMVGHFTTLLLGIAADPEQRLSALPLLAEAERRQVLVEWNDTVVPYPALSCIQDLVEAQVARMPGALAVASDRELTYGELNRRANQLGHHLQALGVGPEVVVGVLLERSTDLIVTLLGVLKAGGAYLPLDPAYPPERLAVMLADAGAPVLVTQAPFLAQLPALQASPILLDSDGAAIRKQPVEPPTRRVSPANLAYVIYTSGSTGTPKGVPISHRGLVNLVSWHQRTYQVTPSDRATLLAGLAFDASVWELWPYIAAGASIHIPDDDTRASPAALVQWLATHDITLCFLPTPLAEAVLEEPWPREVALRFLLTGGDQLHLAPPSGLPFALVNHYGPTEQSVVTTAAVIAPGLTPDRTPPIGRPIANTVCYVLDLHFQPVPVGVAGELCIGGDGLARGYLGRPDLTAEKFIPHPFSQAQGARLYRTGDLVRYRPDGNLEFLGRLDHQVKVRGFRIELGEIEATLRQHPAVREAVVVLREDRPGSKRLVAYVTPSDGSAPATEALRQFLAPRLPDHMVPTAFVTMDALPVTPNGKLDRRSLPAPTTHQPGQTVGYQAPRSENEQALATIWMQVLGLSRVDIHDNFFALGGDSILVIQIVNRASQAGLALRPTQVFQHQTIAELGAVAQPAAHGEATPAAASGIVPLTPIQRWFFQQQLPDPHHFNQAAILEVDQTVDASVLEGSLHALLLHHDALRLRFNRRDDGWTQVNAGPEAALPVPLTCVNLASLPSEEQDRAVEQAATEAQASLQLTVGPLLRAVLFLCGPEQSNRLLLVVHHLVIDGVSWRILLEDLDTIYQQVRHGQTPILPPRTTSFQQWALLLEEYAQSKTLRHEQGFWLDGRSAPRPLPVDLPGGANSVAAERVVVASLDTEETRALLQEAPHRYHTQINDILLTALVQGFARWTGEPSLFIDLEGHGREAVVDFVDLSRTVGWFTTVFPVYLQPRRLSDPGAALTTVKEQLRRIPNRGIGYGVLRYLGYNPGDGHLLSDSPEPEVSFNYLGQFDQQIAGSTLFAGLQAAPGELRSPRQPRGHLLDVSGIVAGGQLELSFFYSEQLHRRHTVEDLAGYVLEALRALIRHCQSGGEEQYTPSDFPLTNVNQRQLKRLLARAAAQKERLAR